MLLRTISSVSSDTQPCALGKQNHLRPVHHNFSSGASFGASLAGMYSAPFPSAGVPSTFSKLQLITVLCQFLIYSKVIHICIYVFFIFFSIMVYYNTLNIVPCAIQQDLVVYLFYIQQFVSASPKLLIYSSPPFPFGNHKFVFSVCESISVSQIGSLVSYFRFYI